MTVGLSMIYLFRARSNETYIANVPFEKLSRRGLFPIFWGQEKIYFLFQNTLSSFFAFAEFNHFSHRMLSVQSEKYLL